MSTVIDLGTYTEGSIPPPLEVTFEDEANAALDLSAFSSTGKFEMQRFGQAAVERDATISTAATGPTKGVGTYVWVQDDMVAGTWLGKLWALDAQTNRFVSVWLTWFVEPAIRVPA